MTTPRSVSPFRVTLHFTSFRCRQFLLLLIMLLPVLCRDGSSLATVEASSGTKQHEEPYALIFGTVWGPDDHPVYGVAVKIRRADHKKATWELRSDHAGEFAQRVPAGKADYVVWADLKGYKSPDYKSLHAGAEVTVHIENDERADIGLHLMK